jgi:ribonuclease Z
MAKVVILGSSNAVANTDHENTHLVIAGSERVVLVDCPSNPILRLERAGVDINAVTDLVITHFHPDHVSGVPLFLMDMWLLGRSRPLAIYGLHHAVDRLETMLGLYNWDKWPGFFPVSFTHLPTTEMTPVLNCPDFRIFCSPVHHLIPTIGLRMEFPSQKVFAYSCDTEPCEQVTRLAAGADVLAHEAAGLVRGHSSAAQAGDTAAQAGVAQLYLIHYPNGYYRTSDLVAEAQSHYSGPVSLAEDFTTLEF